MDAAYNAHPTKIEYFAKKDGSAVLVHTIQVQDEEKGIWSEVYVDAHSGDIVSSTDFVAEAAVRPRIFSTIAY